MYDLEAVENLDVMQKMRLKWGVEGDENSKIFHARLNRRRKQLQVRGILVDGNWVAEPDVVKQHFHDYFKDKFDYVESTPMQARSDAFKRLDVCATQRLDALMTEEEIKEAVW